MGFRFRKSFKVMPGVRVNLSTKGLSTTIGPRGASVNVSKQGTYLNTSIPGTGLSSRTKIGGSNRRSGQGAPSAPALPKTPQPASKRWFSFGVAFAVFGAVTSIGNYISPPAGKVVELSTAIAGVSIWATFGAFWWYIRRTLRQSKQGVYEKYVADQAAQLKANQEWLAENARQQQLAAERATQEAEALKLEKEAQRVAAYAPHLERARELYRDRLITQEQLFNFEAYPYKGYYTPSSLERDVEAAERASRAEQARQHAEAVRKQAIREKYDEATAEKILSRQIAPGMTREHLIDSLGDTSKVERALTKDGERETLIYGSKTSGSYFHIVNGIIVKAVVR